MRKIGDKNKIISKKNFQVLLELKFNEINEILNHILMNENLEHFSDTSKLKIRGYLESYKKFKTIQEQRKQKDTYFLREIRGFEN